MDLHDFTKESGRKMRLPSALRAVKMRLPEGDLRVGEPQASPISARPLRGLLRFRFMRVRERARSRS